MNQTGNTTVCTNEIDASCRVPLLALFGGALLLLAYTKRNQNNNAG